MGIDFRTSAVPRIGPMFQMRSWCWRQGAWRETRPRRSKNSFVRPRLTARRSLSAHQWLCGRVYLRGPELLVHPDSSIAGRCAARFHCLSTMARRRRRRAIDAPEMGVLFLVADGDHGRTTSQRPACARPAEADTAALSSNSSPGAPATTDGNTGPLGGARFAWNGAGGRATMR